MSTQVSQVVSGDESDIHDEPHIEGRRVTVRVIHGRVEERGLRPETVAERLELSLSAVYHALAYYHDHPEEMRKAERRTQDAAEIAREHSTLSLPETE